MFDIGDKVVYPHHGAGIIENIEEKKVLDEKKLYYILKLPQELKVMVPAGCEGDVGLRGVVNQKVGKEILSFLSGRRTRMPQDWNRRFKKNKEKIKSGDIFELAEVVKNLTIRDSEVGLSSVEKRMLSKARQILISELALALKWDEKKVESEIERNIQNKKH